MRSLSLKLTLAFLIVGVISIALVAIVVQAQTRSQFDRFVLDRFEADLVEDLTVYYAETGSWDGIGAILVRNRDNRYGPGMTSRMLAPIALLDANRTVVYGGLRYQAGAKLPQRQGSQDVPINVEGDVVGYLIFDVFRDRNPAFPDSPEARFLANMNKAIRFGASGAIVLALLLGALLARTITHPIRELTEATERVAQGELGHQVPIRTGDELGDLAASFNKMSADLFQSNQTRRQMTADVAHDLRTPLSVLIGYTESLSDGKLHGSPEMYNVMHREALQLNRLIDDLRTLSLADAGELPLTRRSVAPLELLNRIAGAYQVQARLGQDRAGGRGGGGSTPHKRRSGSYGAGIGEFDEQRFPIHPGGRRDHVEGPRLRPPTSLCRCRIPAQALIRLIYPTFSAVFYRGDKSRRPKRRIGAGAGYRSFHRRGTQRPDQGGIQARNRNGFHHHPAHRRS